MLSIGRFAELAKVSARTVRFYESMGLLPSPSRGENNYRYYDKKWLERMHRIRDLQSLGFSLDDIKTVISFSQLELGEQLKARLLEIDQEILSLEDRRERVKNLLSVSTKIATGVALTETERTLYMESIRKEIIQGLKSRNIQLSGAALEYLKRDEWLHTHPHMNTYLEAIKKCVEFAKEKI